MGTYTTISSNTFDDLQLDAGVLLKNFNPANATAPDDDDIITATTGGIQISMTPTYSDFGEDVDNCPVNTKELKHLDRWEGTISFTALGVNSEVIKMSLGAADSVVSGGYNKIVPRENIKQADFQHVWWVGDLANGGAVAVELLNALSTGGFGLQTTKAGKGQISCTLTGHTSISEQGVMPVNIYLIGPSGSTSGSTSGSINDGE